MEDQFSSQDNENLSQVEEEKIEGFTEDNVLEEEISDSLVQSKAISETTTEAAGQIDGTSTSKSGEASNTDHFNEAVKEFNGLSDVPPGSEEASLKSSEASVNKEKELLTQQRNKEKHALFVRDQALILFDRTRPLHDLSEDSRNILEIAALNLDLPIPSNRKKTYKAAKTLVRSQFSEELSSDEQQILAVVLALHQRKIKRKALSKLDITPLQQRESLTITALLWIANGLADSGSYRTTIQQVEPAVNKMWIVVDGPQAITDAAAAQNNARLWEAIGYPRVKVLESTAAAEILLPYPQLMEEIGIEPDDQLSEAGRKVMRFQFAEMLRHEESTRLGEDIEALHDMRVATRRLRATFEVFYAAFKPGALKPYLRGLRATGRALGDVRDLDVFMEKAKNYLGNLPEGDRSGLDPLFNAWEDKRDRAREKMLSYLDSPEYATFKRKFNIFIQTPGTGARKYPKEQPTPQLVRELAPVLIYTRMASVSSFAPFLEKPTIERLHALRIEFKKLRYSIEYFQEVLGKQSRVVITDLKNLQDHLGDLNDAQVASVLLHEFIETWEAEQEKKPKKRKQKIEAVINYLEARQAEKQQLMAKFQETWKRFDRPEFRENLSQAISVL